MNAGDSLGWRLEHLLLERSGGIVMQLVAWWYYLQQSLLAGVFRVLGYALKAALVIGAVAALALAWVVAGLRRRAGDGSGEHGLVGAFLGALDRLAPLVCSLTHDAPAEAHRVVSYPAWTAAVLGLAVTPVTGLLASSSISWVLVIVVRHGLIAGATVAGLAQLYQTGRWLFGRVELPSIRAPTPEGWS